MRFCCKKLRIVIFRCLSCFIWDYLPWFMQTRVKDYARVLNVWFVFFHQFFLPLFDPYSGYSGILRHIRTLQNPSIFDTLLYLRTRGIFRTLVYSGFWITLRKPRRESGRRPRAVNFDIPLSINLMSRKWIIFILCKYTLYTNMYYYRSSRAIFRSINPQNFSFLIN